ncbi:MAG: hypothetical protein M1837_006409 [Sclerophora amabilis]|nr:MAG: hypothetical protein M1837_006409 [Sclerophora amabilis]
MPLTSLEERRAIALRNGVTFEEENNEPDRVFHPRRARATEDRYEERLKVWVEFMQQCNVSPDNALSSNQSPPTSAKLRNFVTYYATTRKGLISKLPTVSTIQHFWFCFFQAFQKRTNITLSKEVKENVKHYIETDLQKQHKLSFAEKDKYFIGPADFDILLNYLWTSDDHDYIHERYRVQLSLLLMIFCYTGARAGSIVESGAYRNSGKALTYKDVQFHLKQASPRPEFIIEICLCNRILLYKTEKLHSKIILFFLAIALADGAFKRFDTLEKIMHASILKGRSTWTLEYKQQWLETPVLRTASSGTLLDRPLQYSTAWDQVKQLGRRVGYKDNLRIHSFRRGVANLADKNGTESERNKLLGHSSDAFRRHYMSQISGLDFQAIFHGETQRADHFATFRSMSHLRDEFAPTDLPSAEVTKLRNSSEVQLVEAKIDELNDMIVHNADISLIQQRKSLHTRKRKLKRVWTRDYRRRWWSDSLDAEAQRQLQTVGKMNLNQEKEFDQGQELDIGGPEPRTTPKSGSQIFPFVRQFLPERDCLAESLLEVQSIRSLKGSAVITDLIALCGSHTQVAYRPDEKPHEGKCLICAKPLAR